MTRFVWRTVPALALVAVATAAVGNAAGGTVAGTVRHVAPGGAGTECTAAAPCALEAGIEGAAAGDEVVIASGSYTAATGPGDIISVSAGVTVRGAAMGAGRRDEPRQQLLLDLLRRPVPDRPAGLDRPGIPRRRERPAPSHRLDHDRRRHHRGRRRRRAGPQRQPARLGRRPGHRRLRAGGLAGLGPAPFTTYHYRVAVTSDGGADQSEPASFTTPADPASAVLGEASEIGETQVTLSGEVDTGGAPGTVRFELTPVGGGLTIETPAKALPAADGPRAVGGQATGLAPGTEYDVVLVLTTPAAGTLRSASKTLRSAAVKVTTLEPPPAPPGTPPDTKRPRLTVRLPGAVRIGKHGVLVAKVTRDELCTLDATARLGVRGGKPARFRLLPRSRITLRLRPVRTSALVDVDNIRLTLTGARKAALKAIKAGRRVVVRIDIKATDAAGNARKVRIFVQVRR